MSDRTYWHVPGARSWHGNAGDAHRYVNGGYLGLCGRTDIVMRGQTLVTELADRIPPNAHLCGSCARVIAARTDIEGPRIEDMGPMGDSGAVAPI